MKHILFYFLWVKNKKPIQTMADYFDAGDWKDWWNKMRFKSTGYANTEAAQNARRFRAHFREVVQTVDPTLTDAHLEQFVDAMLPFHANKITGIFTGARNSNDANDRIADYVKFGRESIETSIKGYRQSVRSEGVFADELDDSAYHKQGHTTLNNKLRSRYMLPGTHTADETWMQSLNDTTHADLFSWRPTTDTGLYSSVHLDEKRHEDFLTIRAGAPRNYQRVEQLVGTGKIPDVWNDQQPVVENALELIDNDLAMAAASAGPLRSIALDDQQMTYEPFTGKDEMTYMTPSLAVDHKMRPDLTTRTHLKQMDAVGFRDQLGQWRHPREPEDDQFVPTVAPSRQTEKINMEGYSVYSTF